METKIDYANNGSANMDAGYHFKNKAISKNLYFLIAVCFTLLTVFSGCEKDKMSTTEGNVKVTSVSLDQTELTLEESETKTLTITVEPSHATNQNVKWTSSDDAVVSVVNGVVKATGIGTAKITVTTEDGGFKSKCHVAVSAL